MLWTAPANHEMNIRAKKILFWVILLSGAGYVSGFFSPPEIHYRCVIELGTDSESARNVTVTVPYPYYDPLPWATRWLHIRTARPVSLISHAFQSAASAKKVNVSLAEDGRRGKALSVFIPALNHDARSFLSHKLILEFPESFPLPFFLTPAYLFKQPSEVFSLNPLRTTIYWDEKDKGFVVNKKRYTSVRVEGEKKNVSVRVLLTVKKRYFLGTFYVKYEAALSGRKAARASSWQEIPLVVTEKKSLM